MHFMCRKQRAVPVKVLLPRIRRLKPVRAFIEKGVLFVQVKVPDQAKPTEVAVGLSTAPWVQEEAGELAEYYAKGCPDPKAVAASDARYEVSWELEHSLELIDLHYAIHQELKKRCGAIGFNCAIVEWL